MSHEARRIGLFSSLVLAMYFTSDKCWCLISAFAMDTGAVAFTESASDEPSGSSCLYPTRWQTQFRKLAELEAAVAITRGWTVVVASTVLTLAAWMRRFSWSCY
jgi:hypothetical protein